MIASACKYGMNILKFEPLGFLTQLIKLLNGNNKHILSYKYINEMLDPMSMLDNLTAFGLTHSFATTSFVPNAFVCGNFRKD